MIRWVIASASMFERLTMMEHRTLILLSHTEESAKKFANHFWCCTALAS